MGKLRLGVDLGTNSIGWTLVELEDSGSWIKSTLDAGVRIFSNSRDGKTLVPLSVERRIARGMRTQRDRRLMRKRYMVKILLQNGLLPNSAAEREAMKNLCPYKLRHEGLNRKLSGLELARVMMHLVQRRGFKSNRKDLAKEEGGKSLGEKISKLKADMKQAGSETLGSFLYTDVIMPEKGLPARMRPEGEWYPNRAEYQREFDLLKVRQQEFGFQLSETVWAALERALFFQRPLRKQTPGNCLFRPSLLRGRKALPSFQLFRSLSQLSNLRVAEPGKVMRALSAEQHHILKESLETKDKLKFDMVRKALKLPEDAFFNLESSRTGFSAAAHLFGDKSSKILANKKLFGKKWFELPLAKKDMIVELLFDDETGDQLKACLDGLPMNLTQEQITAIVQFSPDTLEAGYSDFSQEVLHELVAEMQKDPMIGYSEAAERRGYLHSDFRPEKIEALLPYYGKALAQYVIGGDPDEKHEEKKYGKIGNPTVHVVLNQLRKIYNLVVEKHGAIDQVVVEVARDVPLGEQGLRALSKKIKDNEKNNIRWASTLAEHGINNSFKNRLKLRLWEELNKEPLARCCPYSGEVISLTKLFSNEVEIDHILPRSKTFTNHHSNLIVCMRKANQYKGDKSPADAFTNESSPYKYEEVVARAQHLPKGKLVKFAPDAMDRFADSKGFLERQLNDTRYVSKIAALYLRHACENVYVSRGTLTAFVRSELALGKLLGGRKTKNRDDHRHHTVDAFILTLCMPNTLLELQKRIPRAMRSEAAHAGDLSSVVVQFKSLLDTMTVSHKVEHSPNKKLFEETSYGYRVIDGEEYLRVRKAVEAIGTRDRVLSGPIADFIADKSTMITSPSDLAATIYQQFSAKKLRVGKKDASAVVIEHHSETKKHSRRMIPLDVCKIEFWRLPGSSPDSLTAVPYASFEVLRGDSSKKPHPAAKKLFALYKGDTVRLETAKGAERTVTVESLKPANGLIMFSDHYAAQNENAKGRSISFSGFAQRKLRPVHVDPIGRVKDAGAWWVNDSKNTGNSDPREAT